MSVEVNTAQAELSDAIMRVQNAIRDRMVESTKAATEALTALAAVIEGETSWPPIDAAITAAVADANHQTARVYVCANCYRRIEGPMILEQAQPSPRMVHYPACPSKDEPE